MFLQYWQSFLQSEIVKRLQNSVTALGQGECFSVGPNLTLSLPKPCVAS